MLSHRFYALRWAVVLFRIANFDESLALSTSPPTHSLPKIGAPMPEKRPDWFRVPAPGGPNTRYDEVKTSVRELGLATVCEEAQCPNIGECWSGGTGTIMLLGDTCTRGCKFCAVNTNTQPLPPDPQEPFHTAQAVAKWGINYVVLTSVDRDDMEDGGAAHFGLTVDMIKLTKPSMRVECLVGDFQGNKEHIGIVASSNLDVYAHNVETVERLTPYVRDRRATYAQSLQGLEWAKRVNPGLYTKSSIMLGLGETHAEVERTMVQLRAAGVDVLTLGQYLRPTERHLSVVEYITPALFDEYKATALELGFAYVAAGPLVRSSYKAGEFFMEHLLSNPHSQPTQIAALEKVDTRTSADLVHA